MANHLQPDPKRAITFLSWLMQGAPLHLERMNSVGEEKPLTGLYLAGDTASAEKFVGSNNGPDRQRNIYFLPNAEFGTGKRGKNNLRAVRFLHADLDAKDYPGTPSEQLDRIVGLLLDPNVRPKTVPAPSAVIFSGGGYQAFWRLGEPISVDEAFEMNQALLEALDGKGNTCTPAQLMRLPWTVNWLNDRKREAGREPALAIAVDPVNFSEPPASYPLSDFKLKRKAKTNLSLANPKSDMPDLSGLEPLPLPDELAEIFPSDPRWIEAIVDGRNPSGKEYESRSELVIAGTIWMVGQGMEPGHILSILLDSDFAISAHVLDQSNPLRAARRQIARAIAFVAERDRGWPHADDEGRPVRNHPNNIRYALLVLGVDARFNKFTQSGEVTGQDLEDRDLNDVSEILSSLFLRKMDFSASPAAVKRELIAIAHDQSYHPVLDYLDGLEWDGTPRIDNWLRDYCGAADTELNKEFGSKLLIAGVRRIKQPGEKFDTMLVLEGKQGLGKSRLVAKLAVRDEWFCDSLDLKSDDKTKAELLASAWIVECQELDGMNKVTSQNLKKFLGTRIDKYRKAYARDAGSFKRHCIILGTTNEDTYLRDLSGNRRFWPVLVGDIDIEAFGRDVHQLWAEAVQREAAGESITLSRHLWDEAKKLQQARMVEDSFEAVLEGWFEERLGRVSLESVRLLLNIEGGDGRPGDGQRIKAIMERLGWDYGNHRLSDLAQTSRASRKGYARGTREEREVEWVAEKRDGRVVLLPAKKRDRPPF